jgi:hypothetical protein
MPSPRKPSALESPPQGEEAQIDRITGLMEELLNRRYAGKPRFLRGVHPKDHGCVEATFTVAESLAPQYQAGIFRKPGEIFRAAIRFSNAAPLVLPDCLPAMGKDGKPVMGPDGKPVRTHGSRGMAVKLYDVSGSRLVPGDHERTQDFLMINQPFFAFANVEDYMALNEVILKDNEKPDGFFARLFAPFDNAVRGRAARTREIFGAIQSGSATAPYQAPPLSPFDNTYFGAAPFGFGEGRVMRFSAKPVNPMTGPVGAAVQDSDYLRNALRKRMDEAAGKPICFDFQIQVRDASQVKIEEDIEDACRAWPDEPVTVARIAIPSQDFTSAERQEFCETLFYTPWHGLDEHRPLGGINRLRQDVYQKSAEMRGCPASPELPPQRRRTADTSAGQGQAQADQASLAGLRPRRP